MTSLRQEIISVVVPVYNEGDFLTERVEDFISLWKRNNFGLLELLVVENGSNDNSWNIILSLANKHSEIVPIHLVKASYGQALKKGLLAACGKTIICIDVDYYDFNFIQNALTLLSQFDVVVGSKVLSQSVDSRQFTRLLTTRILNWSIHTSCGYPGTDTHGLKCFRNTSLLKTCILACVCKDELYDTELLIRLYRDKVRIKEVPVHVFELRESRTRLIMRIMKAIPEYINFFFSGIFEKKSRQHIELPVVVDDYGWSIKTDKSILKALHNNHDYTVSILANMISLSSIKLLLQFSRDKAMNYSFHFNLIEGKPCSDPHRVNSLVDRNGNFYAFPQFFLRLVFGFINLDDVQCELLTQYNKLANIVDINHFDSHQHIHLLYPISELIRENYPKIGCPLIRSRWSSLNYLVKKPLKFICLIILIVFSRLRFICFHTTHSILERYQDEHIIHPGFNYD